MKRLFLIFSLTIGFSTAWSAELFEMYRPVRNMGMGGILTIHPHETDAVLLNASFLRWNSGLDWEVVNLQAGGDVTVSEIYRYTAEGGDFSSASDYDQWFGKPFWFHAFGKTSLALPFMGFAIFTSVQLSGELNNPAYPKFNLNYVNDNGTIAGFGLPVGPMSSVGIAVKRIQRWGGDQAVSLGTIAGGSTDDILDEFQNKGTGFGLDLSTTTKIDIPFQPMVTLVWQDVGCTQFTKTGGAQAPPRIKDNLTFGVGSKLDLPGLDITAGFEYRHITLQGEQLGKKLHFGTEVSLPLIDLRAGMSQGYPTYGAAIDFWFLRAEGAMWKEELGEYPGQTPQQRYEVSVSLQLGFDANFSLSDGNGRKRKLKQRR